MTAPARVDFRAMRTSDHENPTPDPLELFERHRTVRRYRAAPLRDGDLERILRAAQRAPTDATAQMYSFLRLRDPGLRARVAELSSNPHLASAPEAFIVLADVHRLRRLLEHRGHEFGDWPAAAVHFAIGDAVLAGQNLLIAAEMLGYAGCWIGGILNGLDALIELLELPAGVFPFAGLTIGLPDEQPPQRPRLQSELVLHEDRYQEPSPAQLDQALERMAPISSRGDWAQSLARYFAVGGTMEARSRTLRAVLERQGFDHVSGSGLDALVRRALAAGFNEVLVRRTAEGFEAWVDRPDRAHRGDGTSPSQALEAAVREAEADRGGQALAIQATIT